MLPHSAIGTGEITSTTDGIVRLFAYRKLEPYPLVIAVGLANDDVLAPWRAELYPHLAITAILIVIIGFLGARMAMHIRAHQRIEAAYRLLADNATDLIMRVSPDSKRLYISPSIRDLTRHEPEELLNGPHEELIHPDDRAAWVESFSKASSSGVSEATYRLARKDGSYVWVEATRRHLPDGGLVVSMRDISARKRAEDELRDAKSRAEQANQARITFFTELSHELRSPLNAVIGFAGMMERQVIGPIGNPVYLEYAGDIQSSAQHLLDLINDILDHAKAEAGYLDLDEGMVHVTETIGFVARMIAPRAESAGVIVTSTVGAGVNLVRGDERCLKQILLNLATNAVKFTPREGRVSIAAEVDPVGALLLSVEDTGTGIAEADQARIFEPFAQVRLAQSRAAEGTGLGLPLTKRLVELHGGTIEIDSVLGRGTIITVRLPAAHLIAHAPEPAAVPKSEMVAPDTY